MKRPVLQLVLFLILMRVGPQADGVEIEKTWRCECAGTLPLVAFPNRVHREPMMMRHTLAGLRDVFAAGVSTTQAASGYLIHSSGGILAVTQSSGGMNGDAIRDAANRVMQQHDYRSVRRRVLENIPESESEESHGFLVDLLKMAGNAIGDFLEWLFSGMFQPSNRVRTQTAPSPSTPSASSSGSMFSIGEFLLYLALAVVILIAIWLVAMVFNLSDGRRPRDRSGLFDDEDDLANLSVPPGELAASTYESRAVQMAGNGNYRAAIRELLVGSMSWIERAGLIRYRKGLTNRDYIRAIWRQEDRREAYITTALEFERVYFGRRDATREMFEDCLSSFQGSFREEEATATV